MFEGASDPVASCPAPALLASTGAHHDLWHCEAAQPPKEVVEALGHTLTALRERGGFMTPAEAEAEAARQRQRERDERRGLLIAHRVPAKIAGLIAAGALQPSKAIDHVRRFAAERAHQVLVLAGQKDGSKTTAACCAIDRWQWSRRKPERWPWLVSFEHILGPWYHRPSEASPRDEQTGVGRRDLMLAELLVLDDVGQEGGETWRFGEVLDQLVKARCDAGLFTIITTNEEDPETFAGRYGDRAARLLERITEFALWAKCPHEGFRDAERRSEVLKQRAQRRHERSQRT